MGHPDLLSQKLARLGTTSVFKQVLTETLTWLMFENLCTILMEKHPFKTEANNLGASLKGLKITT